MMPFILPLLPPFLILAAIICYVRTTRQGPPIAVILIASALLCLYHFHHSTWQQFSMDAQPHMDYVRFILEHNRLPTPMDGAGAAAKHPPLFYTLGAIMMKSAEYFGVTNPEQFTRYLPMAIYFLFLVMGIRCLQLWVSDQPLILYATAAMLCFWPIGIAISGRIASDILLFAAEAGCIYSLMRWQQQKTPANLPGCFFWVGIAVMGKNGGVVMLGFAILALGATLVLCRHTPKAMLRRDLIASILFAFGCTWLSLHHGWTMDHLEISYGKEYHWAYLWQKISQFNLFLFAFDTNMGLAQDSFWQLWLHSLLLGDGSMPWKSADFMLAAQLIWVMLLLFLIHGVLTHWRQFSRYEKEALWLQAAFLCIMLAGSCYLLLRSTNFNYADARYSYPVLIGFLVAYGMVLRHHKNCGMNNAYWLGIALAFALPVTTISLFILQYSG